MGEKCCSTTGPSPRVTAVFFLHGDGSSRPVSQKKHRNGCFPPQRRDKTTKIVVDPRNSLAAESAAEEQLLNEATGKIKDQTVLESAFLAHLQLK